MADNAPILVIVPPRTAAKREAEEDWGPVGGPAMGAQGRRHQRVAPLSCPSGVPRRRRKVRHVSDDLCGIHAAVGNPLTARQPSARTLPERRGGRGASRAYFFKSL